MQYVMFTKHLQEWPLEQACAKVKAMGFDGLDLTVRGGGYVLPEDAPTGLPAAVQVAAGAGLGVPMLTTNITAADPVSVQLMQTAAQCGIRELKLGYWTYRKFGEYRPALDDAKVKLAGIAQAAAAAGVRVNLHIHSNNFITANPAIVWWLLQDLDPAAVGAYADPGHMVIEGGKDVWRQGLELLGPRINLVAIKAMAWRYNPTVGRSGQWQDKMVPLPQGMVDWAAVWRCLAALGFDGTVSLHSEYQGGHSWYDMSVDELVDQTREDFAWLRACREQALAG
ncbi:MAG: sugar phosphate isomerase/epimerase [Fimbriimonadaceae bacterium]|nr:sugar phosphate isomerase/epimerase [Fimbriimonadaceae bacterium]